MMTCVKYVLVLLVVAVAVGSPVYAGRQPHVEGRSYQHNHLWGALDSMKSLGIRALCIPTATQLIEDHEGRHKCAYDHPNGYRAVGVAYNLDDDVESRKAELTRLFADYDKVYKGDACLNNVQITTLLALDAKRDLDRAAESVPPFDEFCCEVQAVFADVQHSLSESSSFPHKDLKLVIEKAALKEWKSAAKELEETDWCDDHKKRCKDNIDTIKSGCNSLVTIGTA